jgi:hypothetical protein
MLRNGAIRAGFFESVVTDTCEFLMETWPEELGELNWRVREMPNFDPSDPEIRRWGYSKTNMSIVLYRIPIQRLRKTGDPRMEIERAVLSAVGALIDRDPWELLPKG